MILLDPSSNPDHTLAASWAGSAQVGGFLGGSLQPLTYELWQSYVFTSKQASGPSDDPDGDGLPNLVEFFLGSLPGKNDAVARGPRASITDTNGEDYLTFSFSQLLGQTEVTGLVEVSSNLTDWSSSSAGIKEVLPAVPNGNGSVRRTFRVASPASDVAKQFLRLRVIEN